MIFGSITALSAVVAAVICTLKGDFGVPGILWRMAGSFAGCFLLLTLLAALFLALICLPVDLNKPQEKDSRFYRAVMYPYIEALMQLVMLDLHTSGLEKTPAQGRFLLVCNHQNESDPGILHHAFRRSNLAFISKKENAKLPVVGQFMHKTLCQLIDRDNDRQALKGILTCIRLIREDRVSVGVFPEGGIKVEHKLSGFRPGVFKIAQKAQVPIVVCTLRGTTDLFRNIAKLKRTRVELHLVEVIPAEELRDKTTVEISDRVHSVMARDLGPAWELE